VKRAFLSDVHGNLCALEATLEDIRAQGAEYVAFLGDAVGYGPKPNECVARIAEVASVELMGNHDYAAIGSLSIDEFNGFARDAMLMTRSALGEETLARIAGYRLVHIDAPYHMVHSSPDDPLAWNYVIGLREAMGQFEHFQTPICLVAHSHRPFIAIRRPSGSYSTPEELKVKFAADHRYLINVGSVGQPRDGNPDASYLLVDDGKGTAEIRRVPYPVEHTQADMEQLNMPAFLIERLAVGK
jgi:diadenosine tetraphosphatase ApaH/serine/threonine PP2A family protein phosphatase